jgi:molecular chaperone DnaJ
MFKATETKTHYQTLEVQRDASLDEIKKSYRRLAKTLHPDRNENAGNEAIVQLNVAYEVLLDPLSRRSYDQQLKYAPASPRREPDPDLGNIHRKERRTSAPSSDDQIKTWLNRAYTPSIRLINQILKPLKGQIRDLSADPFDDELMGVFMAYLEECKADLEKAQKLLRIVPNPPSLGGIAANLYYCINQIGDALQELETFTMNYDETALHAGFEMFRIADGLKREAQATVRELPK